MNKLISFFLFFFPVFLAAQTAAPLPLNFDLPKGEIRSVVFSFDGKMAIVESEDAEGHYFYEYKVVGRTLDKPRLVLSGEKIFSPVYDYNNQRVYFAADFGKGNTDIFYIQRQDSGWSEPVEVKQVNTDKNEMYPTVDPFYKRMFFVRMSEDDPECGTIYYSEYDIANGWQKPVILIIPGLYGLEAYPRILRDGKTLLLVSKGEEGKNFDLYYTKNITKGVWYIPKKLTESDDKLNDLSPALDYANGRFVFLRSKNKFKSAEALYVPQRDEYKPEPVFILYGKVKNKDTRQPIAANIDVLNPTTNAPVGRFKALATGDYRLFLPPGNNYIVSFYGPKLSMSFYNFTSRKLRETQSEQYDVSLFEKAAVQLNVFDSAIFEPLEVKITVEDLNSGQTLENIPVSLIDKGRYLLRLPIGTSYRFTFENEYYKTGTLDFDLSGTVIYSNFEKDVELVPLKKRIVVHVIDVKTGKGIVTEVEVINLTTKKKYKTLVKTDQNGDVVLFLRKGDVYELNITPKGYTFFNTKLDLEEDTVTTEVVAKVEPLTQETKLEFHNITFETNSAELNEDSYEELNRLVELMKKNPNIKVEISAHTDDVGSEEYNMKLSLRRAQSVVNYLKEHGIPEDRMIARGYGETRPLVPNDSEEHRAMNRRVELRILEINE